MPLLLLLLTFALCHVAELNAAQQAAGGACNHCGNPQCLFTTSVALRVNGAIVGWCLTHAVDGLLRFTCAFVRKDLQRLGRLLLLWDEVFARMPQAGFTVGMWTIRLSSKGMVAFASKHMQPYSIFFGETRGVTLHLGAADGVAGQ